MKKILAILLAAMMVASMATVASAAENTTILTTTVPAASYTLNIPANQEIEFGSFKTNIGTPTITNSAGFANKKNVQVTVTYTEFTSDAVSTTIPFSMWIATQQKEYAEAKSLPSGGFLTFYGNYDGSVDEVPRNEFRYDDSIYGPLNERLTVDEMYIEVSSSKWSEALAGEYTATITFTAEVVVEQ